MSHPADLAATSDALGLDPANGLGLLLGDAEACLDRAPSGVSRYSRALAHLRERLGDGRLQVAVLGQFKRGKSSFLNALLGDAVLPTGLVPVTAIATFIRWAPAPAIRIDFLDRPAEELATADIAELRERLAGFVTEEGNPRNRLGVARVALFHPAPLLRRGVVLIDTPGIGSILRHNTDAAIEILGECDAGIFMLSVDPPITEAELDYLRRVRPNVARLFFILNKVDLLTEDEKRTSVAYLQRSLAEHLPAEADAPVFALSARLALAAQRASDRDCLARSGLAGVERHLVEFLGREKADALRQGVAAKAGAVLDAALAESALNACALEMPVEELTERAGKFTEALEAIERQRFVANDLLIGDKRRAAEMLEQQAAALRQRARRALLAARENAVRDGAKSGEDAARDAAAAAIPDFFEARLGEMSASFRAVVDGILKGHVERALALIAAVRETAAALFEIPLVNFEEVESFAIRREPYWVTQRWSNSLNPLAGPVERLLPAALRAARARARLARDIDEISERNVENLRWATLQNLDTAFRRFSEWFDRCLSDAIAATRGAIEAAAAKRREHAEAARGELLLLRQGQAALRELRERLVQFSR